MPLENYLTIMIETKKGPDSMLGTNSTKTYLYIFGLFCLFILSGCNSQPAASSPIQSATAQPTNTAQTTDVATVNTVDDAIAAFKSSGLTVSSEKTESLSQDWFPGTTKVISFGACDSCKTSYVMSFDTKANFDRALKDYSFVSGFYTYGNSNNVLLIISKDADAASANNYGATIGANQSY